ncbi:hypothetical protein V3C99_012129 [Haemonchus contortus]|uniref:CCHC-type domain-containing protein n=1 Tax=Haemonchus contortus TaxID=6289 RepID=A0A7I4Y373_HAECO
MVTMVFIGGLTSVETRKRLLEREILTSKEALEDAEAFERVGKNAPHLKEGLQEVDISVVQAKKEKMPLMPQQSLPSFRARQYPLRNRDKEQARRKVKGGNNRSPVVVQCTCCGGQGHAAYQCFKRQTSFCTVCSRPGHMARACRTRMPNTKVTHKVRQGRREELDKMSRPAELKKTAQDRARPVPLALRPKEEDKIKELVNNGTLTKVDHSEWATPSVVVPKPGDVERWTKVLKNGLVGGVHADRAGWNPGSILQ